MSLVVVEHNLPSVGRDNDVHLHPSEGKPLALAFPRCRACGSQQMARMNKVRKDVHGHVIRWCVWSTCKKCELTRIEQTWNVKSCPKPTSNQA